MQLTLDFEKEGPYSCRMQCLSPIHALGFPQPRYRSLRWMKTLLRELLLNVLVNLIRRFRSIYLDNSAFLLEVLYHWHARLLESPEPLDNTLFVVIRSSTRLATVQQSLSHSLLIAVKEQREL